MRISNGGDGESHLPPSFFPWTGAVRTDTASSPAAMTDIRAAASWPAEAEAETEAGAEAGTETETETETGTGDRGQGQMQRKRQRLGRARRRGRV